MKTNITDNITIREVRISDSQKIYNAIHLHREYLQEWLPFVTFLTAEEEKAFLSSVLRVPRARRDFMPLLYHVFRKNASISTKIKSSGFPRHLGRSGAFSL